LGAVGLPGDYSSSSRFIKAVYVKEHTESADTKDGAAERFFHIMDSVSVPSGCILTNEGKDVRTVYTSCIDTAENIYYFTTYENRRIRAVRLTESAASGEEHTVFDMASESDIQILN
jgi:choloylglycine hydrolase